MRYGLSMLRVLAAVCLACLLCQGCGGGATGLSSSTKALPAGAAVTAQPGGGVFPLPNPSAIGASLRGAKQVSAVLERDGSDYLPGWAQRATADGYHATLSPAWLDNRSKFDTVAYAVYRFDLSGQTGAITITTDWAQPPADYKLLWLGAGDWARDRWDWCSATPAGRVALGAGSLEKYRQAGTNEMLVAVVLLGQSTASLEKVWVGCSLRGDWYMHHRNALQGACSPYAGPDYPALRWQGSSLDLVDGGLPAFDVNGVAYAAGLNSATEPVVKAINPDGTERWSCPLATSSSYKFTNTAIADDGTVYVAQANGCIHAVSANGVFKWTSTAQLTPPADLRPQILLDEHNIVYTVGYDSGKDRGHLYATQPDGTQAWDLDLLGSMTNPAYGPRDVIYVGTAAGYLYQVTSSGERTQMYHTGVEFGSDLAVSADGVIYFTTADNRLLALRDNAVLKWSYPLPAKAERALAVAPDGGVIIGCADGWVYAIAPDSKLRWRYYVAGTSGASLDANGTAYIASHDGRLYALDQCGVLKWWYDTPRHLIDAPVLGEDGSVYFHTYHYDLTALGPGGAQPGYTASGYVVDNNGGALAGATVHLTGHEPVLTDALGYWEQPGLRSGEYIAAVTKDGYSITPQLQPFTITAANHMLPYFHGSPAQAPEWAMVGRDARHSRRSPHIGPATPTVKWQYHADGDAACCDPAIGGDGTIYFSQEIGGIYAFDPAGNILWRRTDNADGGNGIAIGPNLTLYASYLGSGENRILRAFTPGGSYEWSFALNWSVCSTPTIGQDGTIYLCGGNRDEDVLALCAINPDGSLQWMFDQPMESVDPAIDSNGNIYAISYHDDQWYVCAVNSAGEQLWEYRTETEDGFWKCYWVALADDDTVYACAMHDIFAFTPTGTLKWRYHAEATMVSDPAVGADGSLYCCTHFFLEPGVPEVFCLDANGVKQWSYTQLKTSFGGPTLDAAGTLYCSAVTSDCGGNDYNGDEVRVYAINPDGTFKWTFDDTTDDPGGIAIGADGTLYFSDWGGNIFALGPGEG